MSSWIVALIVFAGTFTAGCIGLLIRAWLPDRHVLDDTRDVIKLVVGLVSTMAALVLGLLISTSNTFYNTQRAELELLSARIVQLDRLLAQYGPDGAPGRALLKAVTVAGYERIWVGSQTGQGLLSVGGANATLNSVDGFLGTLRPADETQRQILAQARSITQETSEQRLLMSMQMASPIPWSLVGIVMTWAALVFFGFGLVTRINAIALAALAVGTVTTASAIFLILELSSPYTGMIRLSPAPLLQAIAFLGK